MNYRNYQSLEFSYQQRTLTITINSASPVNAVDALLHEELARVFLDVQKDPDCDLIILTGSGRAFCAGGDMDWFDSMIEEPAKFRAIAPEAKLIVSSLLDLEKPIICRLNGAAAGLGATIALLCDIIIASDKAMIGDPHVKVGLVAGDGGAVIWPQLVGYAKAKELLMTGELITARVAQDMGLINYAVAEEQLDNKINELASKILDNPRWAVRWTKTCTNLPLKDIANRVMDACMGYETLSNNMADRREAVAAFREKRQPNYTGG